MKGARAWWVFGLLAAALIAAGSWIATWGSGDLGGPSTSSRRASGWRIARAYLEARGAEVHLLDRPFAADAVHGTLAIGFPWSRRELAFDAERYSAWVRRGGRLLVGYSRGVADPAELEVMNAFRTERFVHDARVAKSFAEWRRWRTEPWPLEPDPSLGPGAPALTVRALERTVKTDSSMRVLYAVTDDTGTRRAVIWVQTLGKGSVLFLPGEVLANGRLSEPGHAGLLESLHGWLGPVWTFDDYHHGLSPAGAAADAGATRVFDASLAQMALIYVFAAWAAMRRFGRAWREPPVRAGSVAPFLVGLGRLHHRLGHHAEAARLLLARRRELATGGAVEAEVEAAWQARAATADAKGLVALAADVLRHRT